MSDAASSRNGMRFTLDVIEGPNAQLQPRICRSEAEANTSAGSYCSAPLALDTKLTAPEEKYPPKHPYAKLRAATKALVVTISASNACITANTYLVKKIAMITKNGVQLPGMKKDRLDRVNMTRSSRKCLNPITVTISSPIAHIAIGAGLMPKLELMPASDNAIIPNGRK